MSCDFISLAILLFVQQCITEKWNKNIKIPHYCSFINRIHWWPMESPPKGPAIRKAVFMQFQDYRSAIVTSILCQTNPQHNHHGILLSLATQLLVQQPVKYNLIENNQAPHYWSLVGEIISDQWIIHTKGQQSEKVYYAFLGFQVCVCWKDYTEQWKHMSVLRFHQTSNSIVCSKAHTGTCKKKTIFHNTYLY